MKSRERFPLYPLLFALYPILFLYASNAEETPIRSCVKPAIVSILATVILILLGRLTYRGYRKAGVAASVIIITFFSYGQLVDLLLEVGRGRFRVGLVAFPVCVGLMVLALVALARTRRQLQGLSGFLRSASFFLIAMSLAQAVPGEVSKHQSNGARRKWARYVSQVTSGSNRLRPPSRDSMPDIYYIIMDAYSRADVMRDVFGYDNARFIGFLRDKGFYVAERSLSNYKATSLSIASSMNLDYVQSLVRDSGLSPLHPDYLQMLGNPQVARLLRDAGYKVVQVRSEYECFNLLNSDVALRKRGVVSTEFDRVLSDTTMLRVLAKLRGRLPGPSDRDCVLAELDYLSESAKMVSPKFVYAHITVTHFPFYVKSDGSPPSTLICRVTDCGWDVYKDAYVESVQYANKRLRSIVEQILANSPIPPIIVIQGDHSGRWDASILNAYHLPGGGEKDLYPSISPVNTFRVIFNRYLGGKFDLLEERAYQHHPVRKGSMVYRFTPDRGEINLLY